MPLHQQAELSLFWNKLINILCFKRLFLTTKSIPMDRYLSTEKITIIPPHDTSWGLFELPTAARPGAQLRRDARVAVVGRATTSPLSVETSHWGALSTEHPTGNRSGRILSEGFGWPRLGLVFFFWGWWIYTSWWNLKNINGGDDLKVHYIRILVNLSKTSRFYER